MRKSVGVLPFVGLIGVLFVAGCGDGIKKPVEVLVPVSGVVLVGGKPQGGVQVNFTPTKDTKTLGGTAVTDDDGEFRMRNYQNKSGVPVGEYIVTFSMNEREGESPMPDGKPVPFMSFKEKIPPKWSDLLKAGKHNKVLVPEGGVTDLSFKITMN